METGSEKPTLRGAEGEEVRRVEVRPGLVMVRRKTLKPDGRYLLFYDFERDAAAGGGQEKE